MSPQAFTAGVKPGGLTTSSQIRILLCYLIKTVTSITQKEIEHALISEQLVNFFELSDALADLETNNLATLNNNKYSLTPKGLNIADTLYVDVPKTVRECAVMAAIKAQQFAHKAAQHKAEITSHKNGYNLNCYIEDLSEKVFSFTLYLPDIETAELAKSNFIENGDTIYQIMLAGLSGDTTLAARLVK